MIHTKCNANINKMIREKYGKLFSIQEEPHKPDFSFVSNKILNLSEPDSLAFVTVKVVQ